MYVPILKWKQGEQWACKGLADEIADHTYPLLEIPPRPIDAKTKAPKKSLDDYLESVVKSISASWDDSRLFAVDLTPLEDSLDGTQSGKAIERLFKHLRHIGYRVVPVARSDDRPSRLQAAKRVVATGEEGVMIRCLWEDVSHGTIDAMLTHLLGELAVTPRDADLVLDLRTVGPDNIAGLEEHVGTALRSLKRPEAWRSIVVAGSAFPRNLTGMKPGRRVIPRLDWKLFGSLRSVEVKLGRPLWYGDYAIAHWELPDIDVTKMQMSANLRYTSDNEWVVFRGKSVTAEGYGQYVDLCALLTADGVYCHEDYSMGDKNYAQTVVTGKPGNASCWRRDATNHHITLAVKQLATLGAL